MMSLKTTIRNSVREKLGLQASCVGRKLTVFPDDIFLVSYPKSGSTWIRFLISNLLQPNLATTFVSVQETIPDIYLVSDRELKKKHQPRFLKSHEYFDPRYKKVIFIVRDPRDVVFSSYFHFIKYGRITEETSLEQFSERFLSGQYDFIGESNPLGSWEENTGSWLGAKRDHTNDFLLLRYEDFQTDIVHQLHKIVDFLDLSSSEKEIENAIKNSSTKRMRHLEQEQKNVWPTKYAKQDISFVRSAVSGQGRAKLPQSIVSQIESLWRETMQKLGYL